MGSNFDPIIRVSLPKISTLSPGEMIFVLLPYIFGLAGFAVLIFIIWGGFQVLTSQGDPKALESGREKITYAVVGFVIIFTAYWVIRLIGISLQLKPIMDIFGTQ